MIFFACNVYRLLNCFRAASVPKRVCMLQAVPASSNRVCQTYKFISPESLLLKRELITGRVVLQGVPLVLADTIQNTGWPAAPQSCPFMIYSVLYKKARRRCLRWRCVARWRPSTNNLSIKRLSTKNASASLSTPCVILQEALTQEDLTQSEFTEVLDSLSNVARDTNVKVWYMYCRALKHFCHCFSLSPVCIETRA